MIPLDGEGYVILCIGGGKEMRGYTRLILKFFHSRLKDMSVESHVLKEKKEIRGCARLILKFFHSRLVDGSIVILEC